MPVFPYLKVIHVFHQHLLQQTLQPADTEFLFDCQFGQRVHALLGQHRAYVVIGKILFKLLEGGTSSHGEEGNQFVFCQFVKENEVLDTA